MAAEMDAITGTGWRRTKQKCNEVKRLLECNPLVLVEEETEELHDGNAVQHHVT
mgnify:CR=1 FL=1